MRPARPSNRISQFLRISLPIRHEKDGSLLKSAARIRIVWIRGRFESGKLTEPQYSSQRHSPPITLIGIAAFVRKSPRFLANTLLTMVNGEPVSMSAVTTWAGAYSSPTVRPASIVSSVFATMTFMQGPGSARSNGFQFTWNVCILCDEVYRFVSPNLLYQKTSADTKFF